MDLEVRVEKACGGFGHGGELYVHIVSRMTCIVDTNAESPSIADIRHSRRGKFTLCAYVQVRTQFNPAVIYIITTNVTANFPIDSGS